MWNKYVIKDKFFLSTFRPKSRVFFHFTYGYLPSRPSSQGSERSPSEAERFIWTSHKQVVGFSRPPGYFRRRFFYRFSQMVSYLSTFIRYCFKQNRLQDFPGVLLPNSSPHRFFLKSFSLRKYRVHLTHRLLF